MEPPTVVLFQYLRLEDGGSFFYSCNDRLGTGTFFCRTDFYIDQVAMRLSVVSFPLDCKPQRTARAKR